MIVECAWCGCKLGQKDGLGAEGTTSGICADCFAVMALEIGAEDQEASERKQAAAAAQG